MLKFNWSEAFLSGHAYPSDIPRPLYKKHNPEEIPKPPSDHETDIFQPLLQGGIVLNFMKEYEIKKMR